MDQDPRSHEPSPTESRPPVSTGPAAPPPPPPPGFLPPAYPAPPQAGKSVMGRVMTSLVATLLILSLVANVYLGLLVFSMVAGTSEGVYREGTADGDKRVVILPIDGGIDTEMYKFVAGAFDTFDDDPPAAIVLRINSGGGSVTASDQIWHQVSKFKAEHPGVKVVASFGGVAASGGYYIAAPADYIFCEQTGITGSIGVIAQVPALGEMIDKLGVEMNTVVADGSKEKAVANNLFENWRDESGNLTPAGEANQEVLKNLLNSAWNRFVYVVHEGRKHQLSEDEVKALATGAIFTAEEAKDVKLIDEVGYLDAAVDKAIDLAGVGGDDPKVTVVRQRSGGLLGALVSGRRTALDFDHLDTERVRTWLSDMGEVRLAYRMQLSY